MYSSSLFLDFHLFTFFNFLKLNFDLLKKYKTLINLFLLKIKTFKKLIKLNTFS